MLANYINVLYNNAITLGHCIVRQDNTNDGPYIYYWDAVAIGSPQPTVAEVLARSAEYDAATSPAVVLAALKVQVKNIIDNTDLDARSKVAIAQLVVDEINNLRSWIRDFKVATNNAGTLAAFKTNVAALPDLADRTMAQAKTAYKNAVDAQS